MAPGGSTTVDWGEWFLGIVLFIWAARETLIPLEADLEIGKETGMTVLGYGGSLEYSVGIPPSLRSRC